MRCVPIDWRNVADALQSGFSCDDWGSARHQPRRPSVHLIGGTADLAWFCDHVRSTDLENGMTAIDVYINGACLGNPGPGGWAVVIYDGKWATASGSENATTSNRMELTAAIRALELCPPGSLLRLYTHSQYVQRGITQLVRSWIREGWRKSQGGVVLNRDLWELLVDVSKQHDVDWRWVCGHGGNSGNKMAKALAKAAAREVTAQ
jgi:ribonuclease HI